MAFWHFGFNRSANPLNTENFLVVDVTSPGGETLETLLGPIGHVDFDGWVKRAFDLSAYAGQRIRIRFRGDTTNEGTGGNKHKIKVINSKRKQQMLG